ncbi:MAG: DUF2116 family Zn-ribbon domain-containing protein [Bacteroidales bacterium]|nr:DUF2116 family Zn-ribbon domain-containing protein [Bacteroidales bacterium]
MHDTSNNPQRSCLECGTPLTGRVDKRFCSDQCRNTYNNRKIRDATNYIRNVNNILRRNRRILSQLNPGGKAKVHRNKLVEKGFDFGFFTSLYITKTGSTYYFCYEYGYLPLEGNFFFLVMKQQYAEKH